jgi:hypothetical protein
MSLFRINLIERIQPKILNRASERKVKMFARTRSCL